MKGSEDVSLKMPENINETGSYEVTRIVNGKKEDSFHLLIWSEQDVKEAEEVARQYEHEQY